MRRLRVAAARPSCRESTQLCARARAGIVDGRRRSEADLSHGRPDLAPGLDSERIAVLKGGSSTTTAARSGADARPKSSRRCSWIQFEDQQLFRSVTPEQSRVASEYVLDISVRDFQAEYASDSGAPTAHVTILGRLISVVDRQLVDTFAATAQSKAADNRLGPVAAAFETAAHKVVLELAQKTATAIAGDAEKLKAAGGKESG